MTTVKGGSITLSFIAKSRNPAAQPRIFPRGPSTPLRFAQDDAPRPRSTPGLSSFVNLHDKLAVWIDIPAVHSRGIKWQSDVALTIDCNQSTSTAEFGDFIEHPLCRLREGHSPIFHQRRDIVPDGRPNEILAVARRGDSAGRIVRISSCANDRRITHTPRSLVRCAAG